MLIHATYKVSSVCQCLVILCHCLSLQESVVWYIVDKLNGSLSVLYFYLDQLIACRVIRLLVSMETASSCFQVREDNFGGP